MIRGLNMVRSPAIWLVGLFAVTPAIGCAQLAGLTDDYQLASAGSSATAGSPAGGTMNSAGRGGSDEHAGETGDAGAAGDMSGEAGTIDSGGQPSVGGQGGAGGGPSVIGSGGTGGSAGRSNGGASGVGGSGNSAGNSALGGSGGSAGGGGSGPVLIGSSLFHDSAFGNDNASSHLADASFVKPDGTAAGDLILVFFGADHALGNLDGNTLMNLGWTLIDQHTDLGTDGQGSYLLYKFADSNEPNPIVFKEINSVPSGNGVQGILSVYRGVNKANPVNAYEANPVDTGTDGLNFVSNTPAITTSVPRCLLIAGFSPDTTVDRPVIDAWPDGFTENQLSAVNAPNPYPLGWANIYSAERHLPNAGTVPASSFAWHVTNKTNGGTYFGYLTFVVALAPAP